MISRKSIQFSGEMAAGDSSVSNTIGEVDVEVHQKYDIKRRIGKGAYGIVWQAVNKETGQVVAVKKIFDAFRNRTDAQRTYREVMFLRRFGHHPNVTTLLEVMRAKNDLDLYLVLEHMDSDLHQVIRRGNLLKDIHVRYIMYQLLQALQYLHSANVIHRDQKPSNILLDSDCRIRVADFGLARSLFTQLDEDDPSSDPTLTEYVATRWYRAPEILLADKSYTTGVDMWSVGCILGEMILGKPLFPGTSTLNQIERIMSTIRPPSWAEIVSMCSGYALSILERANNRAKKPLSEMMPTASNDALDLMTKLLQFCPEKRISAEQALQHPYFNRFRRPVQPESESLESLDQKLCPLREDNRRLSVGEYRQKLYQLFIETKVDESNETNRVNDDIDNDEDDLQATSVSDSEESSVSVKRKDEEDYQEVAAIEEKTERIQNMNESIAKTTRWTLHKSFSQESSPVPSKHNKASDTTAQPLQPKSTTPDYFGSCPTVAAGLPSHHPRANTASAWLRFHDHHLVPVTNYKTIVHHNQAPSHKRSMTSDVVKQNYGRKQFGNFSNASSLGSPKIVMHSYTQSHGTIAASALKQLRLSK